MKTCTICGKTKPDDEFPKDLRKCIPCFKEYNRKRSKDWHYKNRDLRLRKMRQKYSDDKERVFSYYGDKCACCGERELTFLTIDHINNDGHLHRRNKISTSHQNIYGWLVRNNFPDGFQVLCFNCNVGKHINGGICPHQISKCNDHSFGSRVKRPEAVSTHLSCG